AQPSGCGSDAVLFGSCQFQVLAVFGQVEIRSDAILQVTLGVPVDAKSARLVLPGDPVLAERLGESSMRRGYEPCGCSRSPMLAAVGMAGGGTRLVNFACLRAAGRPACVG